MPPSPSVLATALALAAVFATGGGGYWPLVALEVLFGALWALDFPARRTSLYALVGPGRVASAVSLETVSMQVAKMTGPVMAGVGLARLGPAAVLRRGGGPLRGPDCSSRSGSPRGSAAPRARPALPWQPP